MRNEDEMKVLDKIEEKLSDLCMSDEEIREEDARQIEAMKRGQTQQVDLPEGLREVPMAPIV